MKTQIQEFMDRYTGICTRKRSTPIPIIMHLLQKSITEDIDITSLNLKGTQSDLKNNRVNDDSLDIIVNSFSTTGFLRVLDLSFNEIGDKGAITLAKLLKVYLLFDLD